MNKRVFLFNEGESDKNMLGGKGANLAVMTQLGIAVPPGFTITTGTCIDYLDNNDYPAGTWDQVLTSISSLENDLGKKFGSKENPLLLSVRSGARISMPGMMDTVLNVGLNKEIVEALSNLTGNPRFVRDSYRRLIQMFADVVCELDHEEFATRLDGLKDEVGVNNDNELTSENLDTLIERYLEVFERLNGEPFPQDPYKQLDMAIRAVFRSWNTRRAIDYRNFEGIPHDIGTAVNVQIMAYGNFDDNSGTGVLFTRNPSNGKREMFGEFLVNAQGEDVVAGIRTPLQIRALKDKWPEIYDEILELVEKLEKHYTDMQDVEFTIEQGRLFILQTRTGKRTGVAASFIAQAMVNEGLIDKKEAVMRITPRDIEEGLFPSVLWKDKKRETYYNVMDVNEQLVDKTLNEITKNAETKEAYVIGKGLPAGPGACVGHMVLDSDKAEKIVSGEEDPGFEITQYRMINGKKVPSLILVKKETTPEDFHGMVASLGILTMTGGMTSHAALVGRQIGKRVIVGAAASGIRLANNILSNDDGRSYIEGNVISMEIFEDAKVFAGELPIIIPIELPAELDMILDWADEIAEVKVRANADKENDTQMAIDYKTTGTGLARTEHQFFDALPTMREMILADNEDARNIALDKMKKLQKDDFIKLFTIGDGRPITIRLLDPPLHEFLPSELELTKELLTAELSEDERAEKEKILERVQFYHEANPMLGLRGVRLSLMIPRILRIQSKAIIEAALEVKDTGKEVRPEIMVPLIATREEFTEARKVIDATAKEVFESTGKSVDYQVGTMIEIPRAALVADEIAEGELGADFFSFGTNDLHQMAFGFSRDDIGSFLPFYLESGILKADPFQTIDQEGTGKLMEMCVRLGREAAAKSGKYLKISICGEHGGDPASIDFCYRIGLDVVSCSPFRIPIARLATAHATIRNGPVDPKYGKKLNA
jgi:pyruvate,orthophosphate dikinase